MRNRAWRRYVEEKVVKRRLTQLTNKSSSWWKLYNINGTMSNSPTITDYLSTKDQFLAKTIKTDKYTTKHKVKYSPNSSKTYYRDEGRYKQTREYNKKYFLKILKENGIK